MIWANLLRNAISKCAESYSCSQKLSCYFSLGDPPVVMLIKYVVDEKELHGNFLDSSYRAILKNQHWAERLNKPHQRRDALPPQGQEAKECDSSNSSDALLMNIYCYLEIRQSKEVAILFGLEELPDPEFGWKAGLSLEGRTDKTEIDMKIGNVLVEAKLTEKDFTAKTKKQVYSYKYFQGLFEVSALPQNETEFYGYQLIRNVIAAFEKDCWFFLICDARRPDLLRSWWQVMRAVKSLELRQRCGFVLWQEIAAVAPQPVKTFLEKKYGILS